MLIPNRCFLIVNETDGDDPGAAKWAEIIDGMRVYAIDELCAALKNAGFRKVSVMREQEKHRAAFLAQK